jgi:hypothetical protein
MLEVRQLSPEEAKSNLKVLMSLRMRIFQDFPYLYQGTLDSEEKYISPYKDAKNFVLIACFDGLQVVGCATGLPLIEASSEIQAPFLSSGVSLSEVFYFGESLLLPKYRGQGIGHRFFDGRERAAKAINGIKMTCFCNVQRSSDHAMRPQKYRPLDEFWSRRGYRKVPELVAHLSWVDIGEPKETEKDLVFWVRRWGMDEHDQRIRQ